MDEGRFSISPQSVYERLGTAAAPLIVDVRREPAFAEAGQLVVGAIRRDRLALARLRAARQDRDR